MPSSEKTNLRRISIKYLTIADMNKVLSFAKRYRKIIYDKWQPDVTIIGYNAFIWFDGIVQLNVVLMNKYNKKIHYITFLDNRPKNKIPEIRGAEAYRIMCMYYRPPQIKDAEDLFSSAQLLWKNKEYECQWHDAICYDMNSAFSYAMLQPIPDTSKPPMHKEVGEGEIGFDGDGNIMWSGYSMFVFKLMESPFKQFVNIWYKKKLDKKTKKKAKEVLNYSVGYLQLVNPYLRACIISRCNEIMRSYADENTIYMNTDCLVSLVPRTDLPMGNDIGQFKIEYEGKFAFKGYNIQWKEGIKKKIAYRGVPNMWFNEDFDITKDTPPVDASKYAFDPFIVQIKERIYE